MEITLELSCCKYPYAAEIAAFWKDNREALVTYLGEVHRGVRGLVQDAEGNPITNAVFRIKGRNVPFKPSDRGEFWRILLPGQYLLEVRAPGYLRLEKPFQVNQSQITELHLTMTPGVSIDKSPTIEM